MPSESRYRTFLAMSLCLLASVSLAHAQYSGGTGSPEDPYQIANAADLNALGQTPDDYDKHFILTADIDLSGFVYDRALIAPDTNDAEWGWQGTPFAGVLDGNGHVIANLNVASTDAEYIGLFGHVLGPNAEIKNLGLLDPNVAANAGLSAGSLLGCLTVGSVRNCFVEGGAVSGHSCLGGLVGEAAYGTIMDCYAATSVAGRFDVGGLVGNNTADLTNCYAAGDVAGTQCAGGLVGFNATRMGRRRGSSEPSYTGGTITSCHATGGVTGERYVGGLLGRAGFDGAVADCFATGAITGNSDTGGLAGLNAGSLDSCYATGSVMGGQRTGGLVGDNWETIRNCYATGTVSGSQYVGGLVGGTSGVIRSSYAIGTVSGQLSAGGLVGYATWTSGTIGGSFWSIETSGRPTSAGGVGKTTLQMQTADTFSSWGGCGNEGIWTIDDGNDYPRLWWENRPGEPIGAVSLSDLLSGAGTAEDPYLIRTAEQLNTIGLFPCQWDRHFRLIADIDLAADIQPAFNVIGGYGAPFNGVFDGAGYTVSNLTVHSPGRGSVGLFGYVHDPNAVIRDLGLIDPNVTAGPGGSVGSLVGRLFAGSLTRCYVEGCRVSGGYRVGGLIGHSGGVVADCHLSGGIAGIDYVGGLVGYSVGSVRRCSSTCDVSGRDDVGGLVGSNGSELYGTRGRVNECYASGPVWGNDNVGGLAGFSNGIISDCYAGGPVDANGSVGGLAGYHERGTIAYCYATGKVEADARVGGLVGHSAGGSQGVVASFWDIETSGWTTGFAGTGKTTAEMQTAETFRDAGWDFIGDTDDSTAAFWWIDEGHDYPRLWWERPQDDLSH